MTLTFQITKLPCAHIVVDMTFGDGTTRKMAVIKEDLMPGSTSYKGEKIISMLRTFIRQNNLQNSTNAQIKSAIEAATFEI